MSETNLIIDHIVITKNGGLETVTVDGFLTLSEMTHGILISFLTTKHVGPELIPWHRVYRVVYTKVSEVSSKVPSYHDLYITMPDLPRTSILNLPYFAEVKCSRAKGWGVWGSSNGSSYLIAEEYETNGKWLILDIDGHIIVDSKNRRSED
jgi:hypothetical protein